MSENRVALVTGANKGIGLQIAKDLASHGLTVLIGSRKYENGEKAANEIGEKAHVIQLDVTDETSIAAAAESIRQERGADVRVLARKQPEEKAQAGVEIVIGDLLDPASVEQAMRGVDKMFLLNAVVADELTQA